MPLVDDDGNEIDLTVPWCLQSEALQQRTIAELETWRHVLEDDLGKFTYEPLPTGRVWVKSQEFGDLVAYMSDHSPDARVVVDDIAAELWPAWQGRPDGVPPVRP